MRKLLSKKHLFVCSIGSFNGADFISEETKDDFTIVAVWSHEEGHFSLLCLLLRLFVVVVVPVIDVVVLVVQVLIISVVFHGLFVNFELGAVDSVLKTNLSVRIPSSILLLTVRKSSLGVAIRQAPLLR